MLKRLAAAWARLGLSPLTAVVTVAIGFGLKRFYSGAGAMELMWILAPSSWLAKYLGGIDLFYEKGAGFISHTHHIVVGPACAGVNFLLICFFMLVFSFSRHFQNKLGWLFCSLLLAFATTIVTNGVRIILAVYLFEQDIYGGYITPEGLHRFVGTAIYYGSLLGVYVVVERFVGSKSRRLAPLFWYLAVTLGIPAVGRAYRANPEHFFAHAAQVVGIGLLLTIVAAFILAPKNIFHRIQ